MGYLNKQLYIETQKQSYLLKRNNDESFHIDEFNVDRYFWHATNPFAYSLPKSLFIYHAGMSKFDYPSLLLQSSKWYNNLFNVLNNFSCQNFNYLSSIPIDKFFDQNGRSKKHCKHSGRLEQIQKFKCILKHQEQWLETYQRVTMKNSVTKFCNKFNNYFTNHCENKFENIRSIKELIISERRLIGYIIVRLSLKKIKECEKIYY